MLQHLGNPLLLIQAQKPGVGLEVETLGQEAVSMKSISTLVTAPSVIPPYSTVGKFLIFC